MKKILFFFLLINLYCNAQMPTFQWARSFSSKSFGIGNSIAYDSFGNVYVAGYYADTTDFDPGTGTYTLCSAVGSGDIFVTKLDASGNFIWAKSIGGNFIDNCFSMKSDGIGNVYLSGFFDNVCDFDPGPLVYNLTPISGSDIFVCKLDMNGNFLWAKQLGGASNEISYALAIDGTGNVYTTGYFGGTVDFDPNIGVYNLTALGVGAGDIFVSKLNSSGAFVWAKQFGGGFGWDCGKGITVDGSGNVYTTGYFTDVADFDPGIGSYSLTPSSGSCDAFISKLDPSGSFLWAKQISGSPGSENKGLSIAIDGSGNVYTTGHFQNTTDFDTGPGIYNLTAIGSYDIYLSKLNSSGAFVWSKQIGGVGATDIGTSIVIDGSGNVYSSGLFQNMTDFDPGIGVYNLTASGNFDIFLNKLDQFGNFVWASGIGSSSHDEGNSIALDVMGNIYYTGRFFGTVDFDPGAGIFNITTANPDVFVLKLGGSTNIEENNIYYNDLIIFPNPTHNNISIISEKNSEIEIIEIFDITGRKILEQKGNTSQINIESLEQGVYQLQITSERKLYSSKFIKE